MTPASSLPHDYMSEYKGLSLLIYKMKGTDFSNSKILPLNHLLVFTLQVSAKKLKKKKFFLILTS